VVLQFSIEWRNSRKALWSATGETRVIIQRSENEMDNGKKKHFRELLIKERDRLVKEIDEFQTELSGNGKMKSSGATFYYTQHMGDLGTDQMEREKNFHFASSERRYLYHIEKAIEKLDKGKYGICETCGKPINLDRLEAIPSARLCFECKEKEEKSKVR
jgi:RNA polymerase-binding protein DksA